MQNIEWALLEGLSVGDQISLFVNATIIVAPHGAGMTNMIWARPGQPIRSVVFLTFLFRHLYYSIPYESQH